MNCLKLKSIAFLSFCYIICCSSLCTPRKEIIQNDFTIFLGEHLKKESYSLNDTITFKASIPSNLISDSGIELDSVQSLEFGLSLYRIQPNNQKVVDGLDFFTLENKIGSFKRYETVDSVYGGFVHFNCNDTLCVVDLNISPLQIGYYGVRTTSGIVTTSQESIDGDLVFNETKPILIQESGENNFQICNEISTDRLFITSGDTWLTLREIESSQSLYFFKVE